MSLLNHRVQTEYRFLSGDMLKGIAAVTMFIDHLAVVVVKGYVNAETSHFSPEQFALWREMYRWMRHIGRTAFPLFAFFLVEGFFRTGSRKQYGMRLLLSAVLSEIPYDLAVFGQVCCWKTQNTIFTLFLGLVFLQAAERTKAECRAVRWRGRKRGLPDWLILLLQAVILAAGGLLAYLCKADYSYKGIALIAVFYFFYQYRISAAIAGFCVFSWNPWSFPAFLLLPFYNGIRRRRGGKWFYLFYPIHLLALYGIAKLGAG